MLQQKKAPTRALLHQPFDKIVAVLFGVVALLNWY
jgi:hypothetical protein